MKTYINTFYKILIILSISFVSVFFSEACFLLPEKSNKIESELILLCTVTPAPTPEIVDINMIQMDKSYTNLQSPLPTHTPVPTLEAATPAIPTTEAEASPSLASDSDNTQNSPTKAPEKTPKVKSKSNNNSTPKPVGTEDKNDTSIDENLSKKSDDVVIWFDNMEIESTEISNTEETELIIVDNTPEPKNEEKENNKSIEYHTSGKYSAEELELAARVASFEAGSTDGRKAVLNVIYNRCISSKYGGKETSISTEVYRKSQFSVVNNSKFEDTIASNSLIKLADDIFNNGETILPSNVYYFRPAKKGTEWGDKVYYDTIGGNAFFAAG